MPSDDRGGFAPPGAGDEPHERRSDPREGWFEPGAPAPPSLSSLPPPPLPPLPGLPDGRSAWSPPVSHLPPPPLPPVGGADPRTAVGLPPPPMVAPAPPPPVGADAPAPPVGATGEPARPAPVAWPDEPTVSGPPQARPTGVWGPAAAAAAMPAAPPLYDAPDPLLPDSLVAAAAGRPLDRSGVSRRQLVATALISTLLAAVVSIGVVAALDDDTVASGAGAPPSTSSGPNLTIAGEGLDIAALLEKAQPSVVTIETNATSLGGVYGGAGSGVVLSDDGLVLTNAHVIEGAETITVRLFDGTSKQADLVGSFPDEDLALVQLDGAEGLVPAELGSSDALRVGDDVVAIGNALNLGGTPSVTEGIVSAIGRSIEAPGVQLDNLIQTDAAINPGNSGGPLLNAAGQVVGINTAIIDDAQNIGFALAIDALRPLIDDLKAGNGEITGDTPRLGVSTISVAEVEPAVLEQFDVQTDTGAFVSMMLADSAASAGGVQEGDVIVAVDGEPIETAEDLTAEIRRREVGDEIDLRVERAGEEQTLSVVLRGR